MFSAKALGVSVLPPKAPPGDTSRNADAGAAVGSIFGLVSINKRNEADKNCQPPDHRLCNAAGVDAGNSAVTAGNVSTVAFIAGGVLPLLWLCWRGVRYKVHVTREPDPNEMLFTEVTAEARE